MSALLALAATALCAIRLLTAGRLSPDVMQDDNLFAYSTVNETLMFAAQLRLAASMSIEDKQRHVDAVIAKLGLTPARDTIIGNAKVRGVSGGERKRTSVGMEIIAGPSALFLDEPTSGLDSFQALNTVTTLRALAAKGRTVCLLYTSPSPRDRG